MLKYANDEHGQHGDHLYVVLATNLHVYLLLIPVGIQGEPTVLHVSIDTVSLFNASEDTYFLLNLATVLPK